MTATWEYMVHDEQCSEHSEVAALDVLGKDGWELVAVVVLRNAGGPSDQRMYLKRLRADDAVARAGIDRDISTDELLLGLRRHLGTQPGHLATPGFLEKLEGLLRSADPGRATIAHTSARPLTSSDAGILASIDRALLALQNGDTMSAERVLAQAREQIGQTRRQPEPNRG